MEWQWHQLDHMQITCTSLQTDNHASTSSLKFFTGWMLFMMPDQQCQSTEGKKKFTASAHNAIISYLNWCNTQSTSGTFWRIYSTTNNINETANYHIHEKLTDTYLMPGYLTAF